MSIGKLRLREWPSSRAERATQQAIRPCAEGLQMAQG